MYNPPKKRIESKLFHRYRLCKYVYVYMVSLEGKKAHSHQYTYIAYTHIYVIHWKAQMPHLLQLDTSFTISLQGSENERKKGRKRRRSSWDANGLDHIFRINLAVDMHICDVYIARFPCLLFLRCNIKENKYLVCREKMRFPDF